MNTSDKAATAGGGDQKSGTQKIADPITDKGKAGDKAATPRKGKKFHLRMTPAKPAKKLATGKILPNGEKVENFPQYSEEKTRDIAASRACRGIAEAD